MAELRPIDPGKVLRKIPTHIAAVKGLQVTLNGLAKSGPGDPLPIGDPEEIAKVYLEKEKKKYVDEVKIALIALVVVAMAEFVSENPPPVDEIINKINPMIDKLNTMISKIGTAIQPLMNMVETIAPIVTKLTILYIGFFVLTLIPSVVAAFGAGVSFDMHKPLLARALSVIEFTLKTLVTIGVAILAIILMILSVLALIAMIIGLISAFLGFLLALLMACRSDNLKTADDWAATSDIADDRDQMNRTKLKDNNIEERIDLMLQINELEFLDNLVACTLPNGEVEQMTPEDCLAAGGTYGDLVACTLPDGSVQHMTPEDCLAAGGTFGDNRDDLLHKLNNLGGPIDFTDMGGIISGVPRDLSGEASGACGIGPECENLSYEECLNSPDCSWNNLGYEECLNSPDCNWDSLGYEECLNSPDCSWYSLNYNECLNSPDCNWGGDELIITSLKHPDSGVTLGKAIRRRGKRIGFYGSETGETPLILPDSPWPEPIEDIFPPTGSVEDILGEYAPDYSKETTHDHIDINDDVFTHANHNIDCILPNGSIQSMMPEDCLDMGGTQKKHSHSPHYRDPSLRRGGKL